MAACHDKLFDKVVDERIIDARLMTKAGLSADIVARHGENAYVLSESAEKTCSAAGCAVDEISEFRSDDDGDSSR